jgi:hypothetical protein
VSAGDIDGMLVSGGAQTIIRTEAGYVASSDHVGTDTPLPIDVMFDEQFKP